MKDKEGVLTQEMLEEAMKKAIEMGGRDPCQNGHTVSALDYKKGNGYCLNCCTYVEWSDV